VRLRLLVATLGQRERGATGEERDDCDQRDDTLARTTLASLGAALTA
jgi:hypothetical protein